MLALHAGFRAGRLLVWGESSSADRPKARSKAHPFAATATELHAIGGCAGEASTAEILLPSVRQGPIPSTTLIAEIAGTAASAKLSAWMVPAISLDASAALDLLCASYGKDLLQPGVIA